MRIIQYQHAKGSMKKLSERAGITLSIGLFAILSLAHGQSPAKANEPGSDPIEYSIVQSISANDSSAVIAERRRRFCLAQSDGLDAAGADILYPLWPEYLQRGGMGHRPRRSVGIQPFGTRCRPMGRAIKESGGKMVVLVCKHHDGFNLWPPATLTIRLRPARGAVEGQPGPGGCRCSKKIRRRAGVYLSPADLYQLRTNPQIPAATTETKVKSFGPRFPPIHPASRQTFQGTRTCPRIQEFHLPGG